MHVIGYQKPRVVCFVCSGEGLKSRPSPCRIHVPYKRPASVRVRRNFLRFNGGTTSCRSTVCGGAADRRFPHSLDVRRFQLTCRHSRTASRLDTYSWGGSSALATGAVVTRMRLATCPEHASSTTLQQRPSGIFTEPEKWDERFDKGLVCPTPGNLAWLDEQSRERSLNCAFRTTLGGCSPSPTRELRTTKQTHPLVGPTRRCVRVPKTAFVIRVLPHCA